MATNLIAKIDTVEDGVVRLRLRGGKGNKIVETWHVFDTPGSDIHAERYDREGDLVAAENFLQSPTQALRWLVNGAWETHTETVDSITVAPAALSRALPRVPR